MDSNWIKGADKMSLTDTINNTNKQKDNLKTVATKIDNKLVELGGERATDLADVANKMEGMITENYKKCAKIVFEKQFNGIGHDRFSNINIPINLDFEPKEAYMIFEEVSINPQSKPHGYSYCGGVSSNMPANWMEDKMTIQAKIVKLSKENMTIAVATYASDVRGIWINEVILIG